MRVNEKPTTKSHEAIRTETKFSVNWSVSLRVISWLIFFTLIRDSVLEFRVSHKDARR